jgi:FKBP-type peptidyl-prolyl cis-trans isomerase SlyD
MKIQKGAYVEVHYQLYLDDFDGEMIEETEVNDPAQFVVGDGEMLEAFERKIMGLQRGDEFKFKLNCKDAFGDYSDDDVIEIPKSSFQNQEEVADKGFEAGEVVTIYDEDGEELPVEIVEVREDSLVVDMNHPLAGEDLYFKGVVNLVEKQ